MRFFYVKQRRKRCGSGYLSKVELLGEMRTNELPNPVDGFDNRVVEVIDDRDLKTFLQELNNGMRPDESSTASDKNVLLHRRTHIESSKQREPTSKDRFFRIRERNREITANEQREVTRKLGSLLNDSIR